jgi:hypothetical protein
MNKSIASLLLLTLFTLNIIAQSSYKQLHMSWHNRTPHKAYWQQDVHYTINAKIDEQKHTITATEKLVYTNNSPFILKEVYFHLYQNAFAKGSYLHQLHLANKQKVYFGKYTKDSLGTTINDVTINNIPVQANIDNTIMQLSLPTPLAPGQSITINMGFTTYFDWGTMRRRMAMSNAWGYPHYNGVHWYPRISVYDAKKGWDTDQHLNKELYGDYGIFDVTLDFASNYVVEATGALQNKNEVLPDALLQKLQISNFAQKPWNEAPSIITPYTKGERKQWHYIAEHVHDFAFTADPSYRLAEVMQNGVSCVAIAQEPHCSKWQNAASYVAQIIKTFSADFGKYEYPKMVAADANDGMEYPMITLDGGGDPGYRGLLVHEIGHNWFYGMIGNNETYRAALDEGFTQFLTAWGLNKIDGPYQVNTPDKRSYVAKHRHDANVWERNFLIRYTSDAIRHDDKNLNTHSNDFHGGLAHENGYSNVYHKTATMLLNLQYVLGDSLFLSAMQHYVAKWKFAHPYFDDFRQAIIEHTQNDLNWFFDQWLETTKTIDYAVADIDKQKDNNYDITIKRLGEMTMPIQVYVKGKAGSYKHFLIPNTLPAINNQGITQLPVWHGNSILNPTYEFTVNMPEGIQSVTIDTTLRLADVDYSNNTGYASWLSTKATQYNIDYGLRQITNRTQQQLFHRPDVWWNGTDGIKLGYHMERSLMNYKNKLSASIWWNTHLLTNMPNAEGMFQYKISSPIDAIINFENPLPIPLNKFTSGLHARWLEGLYKLQLYATYTPLDNLKMKLEYTNMARVFNTWYQLNYNTEWASYFDVSKNIYSMNNFVQLHTTYSPRRVNGTDVQKLVLRTSTPPITSAPNFNYAYAQGEWLRKFGLKKFDINVRTFCRIGWGNALPTESAIYLNGANPEEQADNKYYRSAFAANNTYNATQLDGFSLLQMGGGLNVRGYTGYLGVAGAPGNLTVDYKGNSGASLNIEAEFDKYIKWHPKALRNWLKAEPYIFTDAGLISGDVYNSTMPFNNLITKGIQGKLRADAGLGCAFTIKHWGRYEKANPLTLRVDCPILLNTVPAAYPYSFVSLRRWVLGVGRSF